MANRTEHIREATARGLEPELRRLMTQHQIELQSLRALHQDELMRNEQQHLTKTAQQLNALRERLDTERDDAVAKERDAMRAKFDKQIDDVEALHAAKFQRFQVSVQFIRQCSTVDMKLSELKNRRRWSARDSGGWTKSRAARRRRRRTTDVTRRSCVGSAPLSSSSTTPRLKRSSSSTPSTSTTSRCLNHPIHLLGWKLSPIVFYH